MLTWNMTHLACARANNGVRLLTFEENFKNLQIVIPTWIITLVKDVPRDENL
ncbi:hypothetical protein FACS1894132_14630 [Clostridia bacterium]|nr:hypothetical protein FACS1894132_14630 [Clostridia bacterium]